MHRAGLRAEDGVARNPAFSLSQEGGYSEVFQYLKEFVIGGGFAVLLWKTRQPVYLVLSAVFLFFLLDDALALHEAAGAHLATDLGLPSFQSLRARDLGEVLFAGGVGVAMLGLGLMAYRRSDARSRTMARQTAAAVGVLAVFAVGIDLLHSLFIEVWGLSFFLLVVEDGGELVVMSAITAFVLAAVRGYELEAVSSG